MKNWNNNFNEKRVVNGKNITIGQQNFDNGTIMIKEDEWSKVLKTFAALCESYDRSPTEMVGQTPMVS